MSFERRNHPLVANRLLGLAAAILVGGVVSVAPAQDELSEPFPSPSSNAALHYNRAMLSLSMVDPAARELLTKSIWDELQGMSPDEVNSQLTTIIYECRHAVRAALLGCQQAHADFGIDYSDYGLGAMPHVTPMLDIGRLITLAGLDAQRKGDWKRAGVLYFYGLRLGRHMTHQPTLVEALTGVEVLENNYFALANWAVRCPDRELVQRAFGILEIFSEDMASPANTLLHEARIIAHRCNKLKDAYPDGPWAEMLLESLGEFVSVGTEEEMEKHAIDLCCKRGVPAESFSDKAAFDAVVDKIKDLWVQCFEETSVSLLLPPKARIARGLEIYEEYGEKLRRLGDEGMLDPSEIGAFFAIHDGELVMTRVVLALAAMRTDAGFPQSLESLSAKFGGSVPVSPYDNTPLLYTVSEGGQDFTIMVPEVSVGEAKLREIKFSTMGK